MHQSLFGCSRQRTSYLERDVQRLDRFQASFALHTSLDGLAVNELHDVEIVVLIGAEIEDRGNVRVPECRGRPGFAQESLSGGIVLEVGGIDHLQGDRAPQVGIEGLVGNPHRSATQLPKATVLSPKHLVLLITLGLRHDCYNNKPKAAGDHKQSLVPARVTGGSLRREKGASIRSFPTGK